MSKRTTTSICAACLSAYTLFAQSRPTVPITVTVTTTSHGYAIPMDFSGLGFETASELPNYYGVRGYFFSPSNTQVITLLQNIGVRNIRLGGGTVNGIRGGVHCIAPTPTDDDIANLFQFAHAAGVEVTYSLRQLNMDACPNSSLALNDASAALYIWKNYRTNLQSFAIGNEPDWHSLHTHSGHVIDPAIHETISGPRGSGARGSAYASYLADWRKFADTILRSVPAAIFSGPDTGAYSTLTYTPNPTTGVSWTQKFAEDEKSAKNGIGSPLLMDALQHYYVGGSPKGTTSQQAIDNMLSRNWVNDTQISKGPEGPETYTPYLWLFTHNLEPVLKDGVAYRMTEANDVLGGVQGASNGYAAALWALDYMQWWAAHGMAGVNFHNNPWIKTDTIVPNPNPCPSTGCGSYQTTPKGYGMKAFDLGGHGYVEPVTISNPNNINVTAYAVGSAQDLYVTIINKTHSSTNDVADAVVTIQPNGFNAASAASMVLTDGEPGNAASMTATLGGASILNNARWLGQWTPLGPDTNGSVTVTVPSTTAAVVRIRAASNYAGPIQIDQNGALEVFGTDTKGNPWHAWQKVVGISNNSLTNNWSGWSELPGITSAGGIAVVKNLNDTLEVFVPTGSHIYHNWQLTPDSAWNGWTDMGADSNGIANLQAVNNADGSLSVFGIGTNGDLWTASESAPEAGWSSWIDLSGQQIQPGFVISENLSGRVEIFGADSSGNIWHNRQTASGSWSGWNRLPGKTLNSPLAIARNLDGRLEIFGVDSSGNVWHNWQTRPGGGWNGWLEISGKQLKPGFVVGQNKDGRLVLFGVALASPYDVWSIWQQGAPGDNFGGSWTDMGGSAMDPQLVVSSTADGRMQLFGVSKISPYDVWSDWQPISGGWNGWNDFGGKGIKFYPDQP